MLASVKFESVPHPVTFLSTRPVLSYWDIAVMRILAFDNSDVPNFKCRCGGHSTTFYSTMYAMLSPFGNYWSSPKCLCFFYTRACRKRIHEMQLCVRPTVYQKVPFQKDTGMHVLDRENVQFHATYCTQNILREIRKVNLLFSISSLKLS